MTAQGGWFGADVWTVLGAGLVLAALLSALKGGIAILPMSRSLREAASRLAPVLGSAAIVAYALFGAVLLLRDLPRTLSFALVSIAIVVVAASWTTVRDLFAGVVVKAGSACRVGDTIRLDGIQGRVERLGYRALYLETNEGEEAIVPYSRVLRDSMRRAPAVDVEALHVFRVQMPPAISLVEAKATICEAALRCHWSSIVREPQVVLLPDRALEITVFALEPDRGPEIEIQVRRALDLGDVSRVQREQGRDVPN